MSKSGENGLHARAFAAALLLVSGWAALSTVAWPHPSEAADPACADPKLPAAILDGSFPSHDATLPLVEIGGASVPLHVAVASDEKTRDLGLMCVTRLRAAHGMIFVFPQSGPQEFWMKNTLVPLDMVWVEADGRVASVAENVPASTRQTPDDEVARRGGKGRFVIELPAGEANADAIRAGVRLTIPPLFASE
jgi:uncharacterized membrane protein (UPF0127 family)